MSYLARWGESARTIATPAEAEELVDDLARDYGPDGTRGIVVGIGPEGRAIELEVAINTDEGRACLYWLGQHPEYAVEAGIPAHPRAVPVWSYRDGEELPQRRIPTDQTRLTPGRALAAVCEYVETGSRPDNVSWQPLPAPQAA